jgi:hypothetical protein
MENEETPAMLPLTNDTDGQTGHVQALEPGRLDSTAESGRSWFERACEWHIPADYNDAAVYKLGLIFMAC